MKRLWIIVTALAIGTVPAVTNAQKAQKAKKRKTVQSRARITHKRTAAKRKPGEYTKSERAKWRTELKKKTPKACRTSVQSTIKGCIWHKCKSSDKDFDACVNKCLKDFKPELHICK